MPIIKFNKNKKLEKVGKFSIESNLLKEIKDYCKWAEIDDIGLFFAQSAEFVLKKDMEWKKYKKEKWFFIDY